MKRLIKNSISKTLYLESFLFFICLLFLACSDDNGEIGTKISDNEQKNGQTITRDDSNVVDIYDDYDEYFKYQGYLNYSGEYGLNEYVKQAAIDILPAWEQTKGAGIKVMVFDGDIQSSHEEFGNISIWNVLYESNSCEPANRNILSHGTAVSGLIAAQENGKGIIGVAPESEFLFIGDPTENFSDADIIKAFEYAKDWGVNIISCSWGSYNASSTFESLVKSFYNDEITIFFAAGNENINMDERHPIYGKINDESELEWVIGVSASNPQGVKSSASNYGSNIDIMTPGEKILSLDLMGNDGKNGGAPANNNYTFVSGTSFSAPITAGVAALMLSVNSSLTPAEIRQIIIETARKNPPQTGDYDSNGFSLYHAYGLLDAGKAVRKAAGLEEVSSIIK